MGYYKRVYRERNPFLKRLSFKLIYMKPSQFTAVICLLIVLAGAVLALSMNNMLPEHFADTLLAQISEEMDF